MRNGIRNWLLLSGVMLIGAVSALAAVEIDFAVPVTLAEPVHDEVFFAVKAKSTFELASLTLVGGANPVPMVFTTSAEWGNVLLRDCWTNTVSLAGLSRGWIHLSFVAEDVFGNQDVFQFAVVHDNLPQLKIAGPTSSIIQSQELTLLLTAVDDDPNDISISVQDRDFQTIVYEKTNRLELHLSLNAYPDPGPVELNIRAADSAGQAVARKVTYYRVANPRLVELFRVPGPILDAVGQRTLYRTGDSLMIHDSGTAQDTAIPDVVNLETAKLTPLGALLVLQPSVGFAEVREWRGGVLVDRGIASNPGLTVRGTYAMWESNSGLKRLNVSTGDVTAVGSGTYDNADLGENGAVAYAKLIGSDYQVTLGDSLFPSPPNFHNKLPRTDGNSVLFLRQSRSSGLNSLIGWRDSQEIELVPASSRSLKPDLDFMVRNGWFGFTKVASSGVVQVWRQSPTGISEQLSYFGTPSSLVALGPDGRLVFTTAKRLYEPIGLRPPVDLMANSGFPIVASQAGLRMWIDNTMFKVVLGAEPQLRQPAQIPGQGWRLPLESSVGANIRIEKSTDLTSWSDWAMITLPADSIEIPIDGALSDVGGTYFRASLQ